MHLGDRSSGGLKCSANQSERLHGSGWKQRDVTVIDRRPSEKMQQSLQHLSGDVGVEKVGWGVCRLVVQEGDTKSATYDN